ncbi:hypothetical protein GCM10025857_30630 [Alicyclobacillus contaminans]|uniref:hypothetical protein n=1 Tax=Alicyclobacillus contaminans TaxID=392016 RepID=UPI00040D21F9|nr:hypothetical protein [Alicyclobacillus contaminans]GMA51706.1 hypothetical protein GCM10025857_30630 [Alicyclobacillus contaminans]
MKKGLLAWMGDAWREPPDVVMEDAALPWLRVEHMVLVVWLVSFAVYQLAPLSDPDTPWHLATGRYILTHHTVPTTDPFSWTMRGQPWVTQEWLFETVLAWLGMHFGFAGLWLLITVVHTATVLVLYRVCRNQSAGHPVSAAVCACLGTLVPLVFWTMRPQMVSYLMFTVFLWILSNVRRGRFRVLWLVPPLMLIWANAHGSSTIGIFMLLLEVALSFVPRLGRLQPLALPKGARWRLLLAALVGAGVGLINPNSYRAYTYALLSTNPTMVDNINEWHSPNFHMDIFKYGLLPFLMLSCLILMGRRTRLPLRETLYFMGSFGVMLIYQRFAPYMAISAAVLLAPVLAAWVPRRLCATRFVRMISGLVMFGSLVYFGTQLPEAKGPVDAHWSTGSYPVYAVNWLEQHHLTSRILNAYQWGGYLIYRGIPTFVDGRTDIFLQGQNVFSDYLAIKDVWWNGPDLIDIYKCDVVLFPSGDPVVTYLVHNPEWHVAYQDATAEVLVRNTVSAPDPQTGT